jgi:3-dehydro-L-gulonate 2-dehydrogenase
MFRLPFQEVQKTLESVLTGHGMETARATHCARLFCETTEDGVYTHGLNRFPRLIKTIDNGSVVPNAIPVRLSGFGALERWDGRQGVGNLNAAEAMDRALALSQLHGIGCVALGNTNHWMRGGSYAWQAANARAIGLCWTNTMPNLPPWGSLDPVAGNNPLAIGVARKAGPVVLDMAVSQFSFGAIEGYRKRGEQLPVPGGFDTAGNITCDPGAIEDSKRPLPIGYWKGSGLSVLLDMTAAVLSLGRATHQMPADPLLETGLSQLFLALAPATLGSTEECERIADSIVDSLHACTPEKPGRTVRYPGEQTLKLRTENKKLGLPVEETTWNEIQLLTASH